MLISSLIYSCELAHSHSQNGILLLCISRTEETSSTPVLGGVVSRYSSHEKDLKKVMREILYFLCSRSLPFQNIDGNSAQSASVPLSSPHHGCIEYMHSSSAFASLALTRLVEYRFRSRRTLPWNQLKLSMRTRLRPSSLSAFLQAAFIQRSSTVFPSRKLSKYESVLHAVRRRA